MNNIFEGLYVIMYVRLHKLLDEIRLNALGIACSEGKVVREKEQQKTPLKQTIMIDWAG